MESSETETTRVGQALEICMVKRCGDCWTFIGQEVCICSKTSY